MTPYSNGIVLGHEAYSIEHVIPFLLPEKTLYGDVIPWEFINYFPLLLAYW